MSVQPDLKAVHAAALAAQKNSYSPYSKYPVGAGLLLEDGSIIAGCNVENSSYGGTICAERNAFIGAVAQKGKLAGSFKPKLLSLVTREEAVPCGLCLQVMSEFCAPDFPIYLGTPAGPGRMVKLKDFLPNPFTPDSQGLG
ncbi:MAG: cytidine deaminase [Proteobacteria bacterium]|nr:MAG: cytidine deaminase [Pseudomonadota bacterium]